MEQWSQPGPGHLRQLLPTVEEALKVLTATAAPAGGMTAGVPSAAAPAIGMFGSQPKRFLFQPRTGRINWRLLHSLDLDRIVREGDVESIQTHMDNVTFARFSKEDLEMANDDLIIKVVQLEQLCIEYLHSMCTSSQQILQALLDKVRVQTAALQAAQAGGSNGRRGRHSSARPLRRSSSRDRDLESVRVLHAATPQKCPFCPKRFQSERYLHEHMHRRHQGEVLGGVAGAPQPPPPPAAAPVVVQQVPVPAPVLQEAVHQPFQAQVAADIAALRAAEEQHARVAADEVRMQVEDMKRLQQDMRRQLEANASRATEVASSAAAAAVEDQIRRQLERQSEEARRLHEDMRRQLQESVSGQAKSATAAATADVQETVRKQLEVLNSMQEDMRRTMADNIRQLEASAADGARKAIGQAMASMPQDGTAAAALASSAQAVALEENLEKQIEKWRSLQEGRMQQIEDVVRRGLSEATTAAKEAANAANAANAAARQRSASPCVSNPQERYPSMERPRPQQLETMREPQRPALPLPDAEDPVKPIQQDPVDTILVTQPEPPPVHTFADTSALQRFPSRRDRLPDYIGPPELVENMAGSGRFERGFKEVWEDGLRDMHTQAELDIYMLSMFQERTRPRMPRAGSRQQTEIGGPSLPEEFRQRWNRNFSTEDQPHLVDVPLPPSPEDLDPEAEALRKQKAVTEKAFINGLGIFLQRCRASANPGGESTGPQRGPSGGPAGALLSSRDGRRGGGAGPGAGVGGGWGGRGSDVGSGRGSQDPSPRFQADTRRDLLPPRSEAPGAAQQPQQSSTSDRFMSDRDEDPRYGGRGGPFSHHRSDEAPPVGAEPSFGDSGFSTERPTQQYGGMGAAAAPDAGLMDPENSWASGTHLIGERPPPEHFQGLDRMQDDTPKELRGELRMVPENTVTSSTYGAPMHEPRPAVERMAQEHLGGQASFGDTSRVSGYRDAIMSFEEQNLDSVEDVSADFMRPPINRSGSQGGRAGGPAVGISGASSSMSYAVVSESPAPQPVSGWGQPSNRGPPAGGGAFPPAGQQCGCGGGPPMMERVEPLGGRGGGVGDGDQIAAFSPTADDSESPVQFMRPQKQTVFTEERVQAFMDLDEMVEESF
eukprot:CAMPEP_0178391188 /NCGR_PEP_ID=MMETSP0689_2-20121128/11036_1 /TAXON_ID=160604 /ORGANISM="Amphidinium massartii, Strain CS-259" /LENGTH=1117 /DNA_ID=CAMNT_0020011727 /DNA_START=67 /DNA_END=3420 /DNA_ORIENTATION=+